MSGRGHRGGRGHTGRGRGRGRAGRGRQNANPASKMNKYLFEPHGLGSKAQHRTYASVKEHIVLKVQKIYEHGSGIAETLREGEIKDLDKEMPEGKVSMNTDATEKAAEQKLFGAILEKEAEEFVKRKVKLKTNMKKAYALIFQEHCSRTMQIRVKELSDFETDIQDDPIKLLEAIGRLMHEPIRATHPYLSLAETMARAVNMRQREGEELQGYGERFKQEKQILKSSLGEGFLDEFVENTKEHQEALNGKEKSAMKDEAFDKLLTILFMRGSDQRKHGSWMYDLSIQHAGSEEEKYPKTIVDAVQIMSKIKWEKSTNEYKRKSRDIKDESPKNETSFAQKGKSDAKGKCYACGKDDHMLYNCPIKDQIAKKDWHVNSQKPHFQQKESGENEADEDASM